MNELFYVKTLYLASSHHQSDNVLLKILERVPETFVEKCFDTISKQKEFVQSWRPSDTVLFKLNQLFDAYNKQQQQNQLFDDNANKK